MQRLSFVAFKTDGQAPDRGFGLYAAALHHAALFAHRSVDEATTVDAHLHLLRCACGREAVPGDAFDEVKRPRKDGFRRHFDDGQHAVGHHRHRRHFAEAPVAAIDTDLDVGLVHADIAGEDVAVAQAAEVLPAAAGVDFHL